MNLDNIPEELRSRKQWVVWKKDKHPRVSANPSKNASTGDPSTWSTFEEAVKAVKSKKALGVGFVFSDDDPYVAIDLDHVIDDNGKINPEAEVIIDTIGSYTEISQSGHGIHIIARAEKVGTRSRRDYIEVYDNKRYFALTGDLWEGYAEVIDSQDGVSWLCTDILGKGEIEQEATIADDLVLERGARPPQDKANNLYKTNKQFRMDWNLDNPNLSSLSDYDWDLATITADDGWSDQEIANLIIAFRTRHGDKDDIAKAVREDYIPRTLKKIRVSKPNDLLRYFPEPLVEVKQYGLQDAEYELIFEETTVYMGSTENFLSPSKARARFYESGMVVNPAAFNIRSGTWAKVTAAMMPYIVKEQTFTKSEVAEMWVNDFVNSHAQIPLIESQDDVNEIFGTGKGKIARDMRGRIYVKISEATKYARAQSGQVNISNKSVSIDLKSLGFDKRIITITEEGRRKQITLWVSPPGFVSAESEDD